jgi:hypothetical protein
MPEVDQSEALVMHLPVGEARCDLYMVDIAAGWEMASVCGTVRDWRKRKNLAKRYDATTDRMGWITDRIQTLNPHPQAKLYAARNWPAGCPPKPPWTNQQVDAIAAVLTEAEAIARAPFHDGDPDRAKPDGWLAEVLPQTNTTKEQQP